MIATVRGLTLLLALTPLFAADWPMYLYDISHSSFNPAESQIDKQSAPFLDAAWVTNLSAPMAAAPTISGRVAYVGTWDGSFYAIDTETGAFLWSAFVGMAADPAKAECMAAIGVTSQAVVVGNRVYVGGGDSAVYAFDKNTGSQIWRTSLADPQSGAYLWSSVTYYNGALYIGVASLGDCPLVRGALVRIDLAQPDRPLFRWLVQEDDIGGGVWSTPAIDAKTNTVYVTTGTGEQGSASGTWGGAMLAMDASTLDVRSYFFLPTNSVELDIEWGSSPTLFETSYGFPLIAATGKDGILYAQRRDTLFPVWQTQVAIECICPECGCGSISTPAFDGHTLYLGAGVVPGETDQGSVYALDPDSGEILWSRVVPGVVIAPVTIANGVLYVSTQKGLLIFDASDGTLLWSAGPEVTIFSQPVVAGGAVYCTQFDGNFIKWTPANVTTGPSAVSRQATSGSSRHSR
jgi:polyvinyl alcohol dehydrogenase (cytochrome)